MAPAVLEIAASKLDSLRVRFEELHREFPCCCAEYQCEVAADGTVESAKVAFAWPARPLDADGRRCRDEWHVTAGLAADVLVDAGMLTIKPYESTPAAFTRFLIEHGHGLYQTGLYIQPSNERRRGIPYNGPRTTLETLPSGSFRHAALKLATVVAEIAVDYSPILTPQQIAHVYERKFETVREFIESGKIKVQQLSTKAYRIAMNDLPSDWKDRLHSD